jgi:hypothetical protein
MSRIVQVSHAAIVLGWCVACSVVGSHVIETYAPTVGSCAVLVGVLLAGTVLPLALNERWVVWYWRRVERRDLSAPPDERGAS